MDVKPDIIFLLGAGASKEAGVPDTVEFVKKRGVRFIYSLTPDCV